MLIVSKILLSRKYEYGSWQLDENKKRDLSGYVVVTGDLLRIVAQSVFSTALALDLQDHVSLSDVLRVLAQWAHISNQEEQVWLKKQAVNAPIFDVTLWEERDKESRRAEVRVYDNSVDLVLALVGTIRARRNEQLEILLARKVLTSRVIAKHVAYACAKVIIQIRKAKLGGDPVIQGEYKSLHKQTWDSWSQSFPLKGIAINIMVLHDIYGFFDKRYNWPGPWSKDAVGEDLKRLMFKNKSTMRHNVGTVNEDVGWVSRARWHDLPVWAGPSGTTYGLCHMLRKIGKVEDDELLACAYALFAFWASAYPKTATPIHHLFGVMIAVSEFLSKTYSEYWNAETLYRSLMAFLGASKAKL
jgi:hypothetical protein